MWLEQLWNNIEVSALLEEINEMEPSKCGPRVTPKSHLFSLWKPLPHQKLQSSVYLNCSCKYSEPCGYPRPLLPAQVNNTPPCLKTSSLVAPSFHLPKVQGLPVRIRGHGLDPRGRLATVGLIWPTLLGPCCPPQHGPPRQASSHGSLPICWRSSTLWLRWNVPPKSWGQGSPSEIGTFPRDFQNAPHYLFKGLFFPKGF